MKPRYLKLLESGEFKKRVATAYKALKNCTLCPRNCRVNRLKNGLGYCFIGKKALVSSHNVHHGEEPPISGSRGSGTIFFTSCNLRCIFCQNYPISQLRNGSKVTPHKLADMMLTLQNRGAHNINLVTPSHIVPQSLSALYIAANEGLNIPIVYNSGGYDSINALKLLDGIIDIYMPDIKYSSDKSAEEISSAPNYWYVATKAVKEMHRQVGDLKINKDGIAKRGLIIRHLVLPNDLSGTKNVLEFIAQDLSQKTYISLMKQYFPAYKTVKHPKLGKKLNDKEFKIAVEKFKRLGLENGWIQE